MPPHSPTMQADHEACPGSGEERRSAIACMPCEAQRRCTPLVAAVLCGLSCFSTSCTISPPDTATNPSIEQRPSIRIGQVVEPIVLDGRLDDRAWIDAPVYKLALPRPIAERRGDVAEIGHVRFVRDDRYLYAAFNFKDSDVVQHPDAREEVLYLTGDLAELFIKPPDSNAYWEFHAAPDGSRTTYHIPGRGRHGLPSNIDRDSGFRVAAQVQGTLNDWSDADEGWSVEMAVPLNELRPSAVSPVGLEGWTVLVGRYNYGVALPTFGAELSSYPQLSRQSFHLHDEYAVIEGESGQ